MTRTWTCQRYSNGVRCRAVNPARCQLCWACNRRRPKRKRPAHMAALDLSYEHFKAVNGGTDNCGICKRAPTPGKRHARDHDHVTGQPRGLLCFRCNRLLGNKRLGWLLKAVYYLKRTYPPGIVLAVPDERPSR